jgi:hypothetical protein
LRFSSAQQEWAWREHKKAYGAKPFWAAIRTNCPPTSFAELLILGIKVLDVNRTAPESRPQACCLGKNQENENYYADDRGISLARISFAKA